MPSEKMPEGSEIVKGYDFNRGLDYDALMATYKSSGFQATNFGKAVEEINKMVKEICHLCFDFSTEASKCDRKKFVAYL